MVNNMITEQEFLILLRDLGNSFGNGSIPVKGNAFPRVFPAVIDLVNRVSAHLQINTDTVAMSRDEIMRG